MKRQSSFNNKQATLYLVATPIGNLSEMTPRAIEILKEVDIIAAEDTRQTGKLLAYFSIETRMIAHHKFNEMASSQGIVDLLNQGKNVALVSDAGYPLISDPGNILVSMVVQAGYNVVPISGAHAGINALVASGLNTTQYVFVGFLNQKFSIRQRQLERYLLYPETLVIYEAPHRVKKTLQHIYDVFGNRQMCLAREITKLHEEFMRGNISEVLAEIDEIKGEIVLVIAGHLQEEYLLVMDDIRSLVEEEMAQGLTKSEAIRKISKELKISKNQIYQELHEIC